jgi:hypothetical protein
MLEHTVITASTTVALKTVLAALSKCITVAKDMYNAPTELDALEEEISLVRMVVENTDDLRNDNSLPTAIPSLWWRLDSKVREVEQFINTNFKKHTGGSCNGSDIELNDLECQVTNPPSNSGTSSAIRLAWSRHTPKVSVFRTELKVLRELLSDGLLGVNT